MLSRLRLFSENLPGTGVLIVFQQQMRARCPVRDLIWTAVLIGCHVAIFVGLQAVLIPNAQYVGEAPSMLKQWMTMSSLTGPILYLPVAAVLGALAAPSAAQFAETQSMLLTRLAPIDICVGRVFAWLWPVLSAILGSCALWFTAQLIWRPLLAVSAEGYIAIGVMNLVLMTAALAAGAIAFLFAMRRRPGRVVARGVAAALIASTLALAGLFIANPAIDRMDNPTALIFGLLLVNPATAAATAIHVDSLRLAWLYERTDAPAYPFRYPSPLGSCALFAGCAVGALALSSVRLRRAYR